MLKEELTNPMNALSLLLALSAWIPQPFILVEAPYHPNATPFIIPSALFLLTDPLPFAMYRHGTGFVYEYEVKPRARVCPAHHSPLKWESVPVVGGTFTPLEICDMFARFPYGRLAASSGGCQNMGRISVFRCEGCVRERSSGGWEEIRTYDIFKGHNFTPNPP
jgi:hypothetical protein